jgi:hypothetical protein
MQVSNLDVVIDYVLGVRFEYRGHHNRLGNVCDSITDNCQGPIRVPKFIGFLDYILQCMMIVAFNSDNLRDVQLFSDFLHLL